MAADFQSQSWNREWTIGTSPTPNTSGILSLRRATARNAYVNVLPKRSASGFRSITSISEEGARTEQSTNLCSAVLVVLTSNSLAKWLPKGMVKVSTDISAVLPDGPSPFCPSRHPSGDDGTGFFSAKSTWDHALLCSNNWSPIYDPNDVDSLQRQLAFHCFTIRWVNASNENSRRGMASDSSLGGGVCNCSLSASQRESTLLDSNGAHAGCRQNVPCAPPCC